MIQMNLQHRKRLTDLKNKLTVGSGEGIVRGFGKVMYTLLYSKGITDRDLLCSIWNSAPCYVAGWMGRGCRENRSMCMCG